MTAKKSGGTQGESRTAPHLYRLMAERADGTGRMIYDLGNDREVLEVRAERRTTPRTRFWVEDNPEAGLGRE
jgi:hypothetical protein